MILAEPSRTPYDFQFAVFGFHVRVTPFFWLVMAILGYELAVSFDAGLQDESPGMAGLLLMWISAVFLSVLIHELGHAFAMRRYGRHAYIVLYHFGGLAIPDTMSSVSLPGRYGRPHNQIVISAAGPAAQLLLAAVILVGLQLGNFRSIAFHTWPLDLFIPPPEGRPLPSATLDVMLFFLVMPSIYWALFNLLPIYPLDGGHISRELFTMVNGPSGFRHSLIVSIVTCAVVAMYFYSTGSVFNAMFLISFAVSNYQLLQMLRYGGGPWF